MKEELPPGHFVILNSFIDRTTKRPSTLHDQSRYVVYLLHKVASFKRISLFIRINQLLFPVPKSSGPTFGTVCHIPMHPTFCKETSSVLAKAAEEVLGNQELGNKLWSPTGTVVTIEGPRFSTKAESLLFKSWNCDVINMTTGIR